MLVSVEAQEVVLLIYDLLCAFLYAYLTATLIACGLFFQLACAQTKTYIINSRHKNIWFIILELGQQIISQLI